MKKFLFVIFVLPLTFGCQSGNSEAGLSGAQQPAKQSHANEPKPFDPYSKYTEAGLICAWLKHNGFKFEGDRFDYYEELPKYDRKETLKVGANCHSSDPEVAIFFDQQGRNTHRDSSGALYERTNLGKLMIIKFDSKKSTLAVSSEFRREEYDSNGYLSRTTEVQSFGEFLEQQVLQRTETTSGGPHIEVKMSGRFLESENGKRKDTQLNFNVEIKFRKTSDGELRIGVAFRGGHKLYDFSRSAY